MCICLFTTYNFVVYFFSWRQTCRISALLEPVIDKWILFFTRYDSRVLRNFTKNPQALRIMDNLKLPFLRLVSYSLFSTTTSNCLIYFLEM